MKVILITALSLDGKIAQYEDQISIDWTSKEDKKFFVKKTKEAGVLIMGRKTYKTIGKPLPNRLNVVMTRNKSKYKDVDGELEFTSNSPKEILQKIEKLGFDEVVIAGGTQVYTLFLEEKLVTDLFITIEPILFGSGVPFLNDINISLLELNEMTRMGENGVLLHYKIK